MDSATAAYEAVDAGYDPLLLHVSYGQRTESTEAACAERLADFLDASGFLRLHADYFAHLGGSTLTDESMPVADADLDSEDVPASYVPFRNANLLSMAVSLAETRDCTAVFVGAHTEDFSGYPDCRPAFFEAFQTTIDRGTRPDTEIELRAPFAAGSKTEIVERGLELGVPYEHTWSCYRNDTPACGTCDACAYRLQAFERAGVADPIEYETCPSEGKPE
jgi:7-cyano-7-deazaguanine synthase